MRYFAQQLGEDTDYRYVVGVLHDIDRDHIDKDASRHLQREFHEIMEQIDAHTDLCEDIRSHGYGIIDDCPAPDSLVRKYLMSVDELSGLLYAYARMRPE